MELRKSEELVIMPKDAWGKETEAPSLPGASGKANLEQGDE